MTRKGLDHLPQNSFARRDERADANFDVLHRFVYRLIWDLPIFEDKKVLGAWQLGSIGTFPTGQPYTVLFCCDQSFDGNLTDIVDRRSTNISGGKRNTFRAPGIATVDLSLNKVFHLTERHRVEFRSEIFNVFKANFGIPGRTRIRRISSDLIREDHSDPCLPWSRPLRSRRKSQ